MTVLEADKVKEVWHQVPEIAELVADADHLDVKTFEGDLNLREFLANML